MNRAYSILDIKSYDNDQRIIEGIASTPQPDRVGDIVVPTGAKFKLPMPLLWMHDSRQPIGEVMFAEATDTGIPFKARIAKSLEPGKLKDRLDEAWQSIKLGLVKAMSIGFRVIDGEPVDKKDPWGGQKFNAWEWLELSCVTIPANTDCTINVIRSIDGNALAALGNEETQSITFTSGGWSSGASSSGASDKRTNPAGVSASTSIKFKGPKHMAKKTIAEQIADLEAKRAADEARRLEIQNKATDEGRTKDEAEKEEFDNLSAEIRGIDSELVDLRALEKSNIAAAKPLEKEAAPQPAPRGSIITMKANRPPGIGFARVALAKIGAYRTQRDPAAIARETWPSDPEVEAYFKTAVVAGTTTLSGWASQLVVASNLPGEFVELLRPLTLLGRVPGFRRVPFNITIPRQTAGVAGQWVGEGKAKPLGRPTLDQITLRWAKAAIISVFTEELARFSNPAVEQLVRDDLAAGIAQFLDEQFCDPANTAVVNVHPGAITESADTAAASGNTVDALIGDALTAYANFDSSEISQDGIVILMQASLARQINMMRNSLGQFMFPEVNQDGGTLFGSQVFTSTSVGSGRMIFFKPSEILVADDGGVSIDVSNQASLQMDDAPTAGAQSLVSLFQTNQVALRAERWITWAVRRDNAVYYITSAAYGENGTA